MALPAWTKDKPCAILSVFNYGNEALMRRSDSRFGVQGFFPDLFPAFIQFVLGRRVRKAGGVADGLSAVRPEGKSLFLQQAADSPEYGGPCAAAGCFIGNDIVHGASFPAGSSADKILRFIGNSTEKAVLIPYFTTPETVKKGFLAFWILLGRK